MVKISVAWATASRMKAPRLATGGGTAGADDGGIGRAREGPGKAPDEEYNIQLID
ncbi:hypothetical protein [Bordetella petrii]|uniref:hypothetical protein n=1 Tax=Bordetella petrii TaxID=94624 RepID=UPI001E556D1D|nr:hypothetical protein [Bordetella petrii]